MSVGKLNQPIQLVVQDTVKDDMGFGRTQETVAATVIAHREDRHGTEVWKNRAAYTDASALFRFRVIPGFTVSTAHTIQSGDERYRIVSVEVIRKRYVEALATKVEPSRR